MIPILYENDEIFVINKPAGLAVQGGEKISHSLDKDFSQQVGYKIYLVHRLDKETAGLMVVAKNPVSANKWTKLVGTKMVQKEYIAICAGALKEKSGTIKEQIEQHSEIKNAVTKYQVEQEKNFSFTIINQEGEAKEESVILSKIRLKLETGRMHQIRIHLGKNNCPIAGDDLHGNFKINKLLKKGLKIKQLLLCSQKLTIPDYSTNKTLTFEIELPEHMQLQF